MKLTPRFRQRSTVVTTGIRYTFGTFGPSPLPPPSNGETSNLGLSGKFDTIADVKVSPFRKSGNFKEWISNPLTLTRAHAKAYNGSSTTTSVPDTSGSGWVRTVSGDLVSYLLGRLPHYNASSGAMGPTLSDIVGTDRMNSLAVIKCWSRVNPAKAQSWVMAAEVGKTGTLILDRARKLADVIRAVRKGDIGKLDRLLPGARTFSYPKSVVVWDLHGERPIVKRNGKTERRYGHRPLRPKDVSLMDDSSRLWLEYRYGWTPLVLDIEDSLKAFYAQSLRDELSPRTYEVALATGEEQKTTVVTTLGPSFGGGKYTTSVTDNQVVTVKAYAKYTVKSPSGFMNRLNDFGVFDIPAAMWEVVPFSFVVDWFIPIGDWLSAISPKMGVEVIDSGLVSKRVSTRTRLVVGYTPDKTTAGGWIQPMVPLGATDSYQETLVTRLASLPPTTLPPIEVKLNLKRFADAVALLRVVR